MYLERMKEERMVSDVQIRNECYQLTVFIGELKSRISVLCM
jgi:hypothetical protein